MTYADDWHTHTLEAASDPLALLEREWLLTNGTGAYAMGTAVGCPTRRYHGLLVAATRPPVARVVTLNQMWEQLILRHSQSAAAPQTLDFTSLMFRAGERRVFSPMGHQGLQRFQRGLSVRWVYAWGKIEFERELLLHWKHQAATLRYRIRGLEEIAAAATLRLSPMLTMRDFHSVLLRASS
ncbi:MAG TPA: glycogen debranching enzyme N-terminal domain-containing protein, partial [Phycisphaeraceae bacterium]